MRLLISLEMTITMMMQMILRSQGEECGCHRETEPGWRHQTPDNGQVFAQLLGGHRLGLGVRLAAGRLHVDGPPVAALSLLVPGHVVVGIVVRALAVGVVDVAVGSRGRYTQVV